MCAQKTPESPQTIIKEASKEEVSHNFNDILTELECLVCQEYMYPPIKQCITGHSMCELCFGKVATCPTCRSAKGATRNYALEAILAKVQFPCKFKASGCTVSKVGATIRIHQEFCEFGERPCPLKDNTNCSWTGRPRDLLEHAKENHDHHLPVVNSREVRIKNFLKRAGDEKFFQLVSACGQIFKYGVYLYYSMNLIQWTVQFVGPRHDASNYCYVIKFIDKHKETQNYAIVSACQVLAEDPQAFTTESSSQVHFDKLKQFCNEDGALSFNFRIFPTKEFGSCT